MAICGIPVVAVAPCQCFSPGGYQITSSGRIFLFIGMEQVTITLPDRSPV